MANEIQYERTDLTGSTLYVVVWNASGQAWNGSAFATYTTTRGDFDIAATEISGTGFWQATMPGTAGYRRWAWYLQAGGSPSHANDVKLREGSGYWDGTNIVAQLSVIGDVATKGFLLRGPLLQYADGDGESGQTTLKAVLTDSRNFAWNTSTSSFATSINSVTWSTAIMTMTEIPGQAGTGLAIYSTNVPSIQVGPYSLIVQDGAIQTSPRKFVGQFYYDGQNVIPMDGILSDVFRSVRSRSLIGSGSIPKTITVVSAAGIPVPNAHVSLSRDSQNTDVELDGAITDDQGKVTFLLNGGIYYAWAHRAGVNVVNPIVVTVP